MTPSNLINFGELSRLLAGNRSSITRKRIPEKHREAIEDLYKVVGDWIVKNDSKLSQK